VRVVVEGMNAKEEICRQTEDHHIDLLVLGTRGVGTLTKCTPHTSAAEYVHVADVLTSSSFFPSPSLSVGCCSGA
jgi:nucleotide-binding universal stress UspA family protein